MASESQSSGDIPVATVTVRMAANLWLEWARIALQGSKQAADARARVLTVSDSTVRGEAMHDEYLASLPAITAAAFAVDAWYIAVEPMAGYSSPNPPQSRHGWVSETLKSGFDLGTLGGK